MTGFLYPCFLTEEKIGCEQQKEGMGRPRKQLPDEEIVALYQEGHSESSLAQRFRTSRSSIHRRLVSAGVDPRNAVETTALRTRKTFPVTERFLELVDGLLLGDAWIEVYGTSEGRLGLEQTCHHEAWIEAVAKEFAGLNISTNHKCRRARKKSVVLRTHKYMPFTAQRHRWYPKGEKRVPVDVHLSPRSLAHWYWGDGATVNDGYGMLFHTEGFNEEDVALLRARLKKVYGWDTTQRERRPGQFTIGLYRQKYRDELVKLIEPYCPSCFRYKIKTRTRAPSKISEVEAELRTLRSEGLTQRQISEHFRMSPGWGGWACRKLGI